MSLMILAVLQAATSPPASTPPATPAFVEGAADDGGFAYTVATLPADKLSEMQDLLDGAAAKRCGAKAVVAGDQSYDQSTDADGLAAPTITHLRMTYKCA